MVTSADLVLAEERGREQADCEKGEEATRKRSVTTEPVAAIFAEDQIGDQQEDHQQGGDQQGEEGDQGIRRRTRAVTADPVMETGVDQIEFPLVFNGFRCYCSCYCWDFVEFDRHLNLERRLAS